jgi:hypothetical protein
MNARFCLLPLFISVSIVVSSAQDALDITFEGPPLIPPGAAYTITEYMESGMLFVPLEPLGPGIGFGRVGSGLPFFPDNGTTYLDSAGGESLKFSSTSGSLFGLVSLDLAEYSNDFAEPVSVQIIGYRFDGSTVSETFTTDGIIDGTGPLSDFETFYFGPEFSGLERVEIPTDGWSLDNLVVTIPEPATPALLLLGSLLLLRAKELKSRQHGRS